ncbi:MAG: hypothetical protein K8S13_20630 [Desulfobacula sp.]|nr:hypothetical protein [Desulfobacula sp.]MCD4722240.1 hypothetical protein [Desulfobacula sp.]
MKKFIIYLVVLSCATSLFAEPLPHQKVPDPLKPWIDWVLHGEEKKIAP